MSVESTRATMEKYLAGEHSDVSMMADDVVFTIMGTGQEHSTPQGVLQMLNYFYHIVFDATAETISTVYGENNAALEGVFVGKHTGEFSGIPATGRMVRVPTVIIYELENDKIKRARVYMDMMTMMAQLGVGAPSAAAAGTA